MRGDSQARAEYYNKLFQVGAMSPNKILSLENMNPVDGGDQHFVMLNMVPLDQARELAATPEPTEKLPEDEEIAKQKEVEVKFFSEDKARKKAEERSIRMRDRLARAYRPLIADAAQAVVNYETKAIKKRIVNPQKISQKDIMADFLEDFYKQFPAYINKRMGPVLQSYLTAVIEESFNEIGVKPVNLDNEVKAYIETYAKRHTSSSLGQMLALLEGDVEDLGQRSDEWQERRADKIVRDELVRASSAAFSWVVFGAGLSLVWRTRGKACPYCATLNGKRVASGEAFLNPGDELDPKGGDGPMRIRGLKIHPPMHQNCQCFVVAG